MIPQPEEVIMYDHVGLTVNDVAASVRFYQSALAGLGYELVSRNESGAGFGPNGQVAFWLYAGKRLPGSGIHIAFQAPDRTAVDRFHAAGPTAGRRRHRRSRLPVCYN